MLVDGQLAGESSVGRDSVEATYSAERRPTTKRHTLNVQRPTPNLQRTINRPRASGLLWVFGIWDLEFPWMPARELFGVGAWDLELEAPVIDFLS